MKVITYCNKKLIFFTKSALITTVLNFTPKHLGETTKMKYTDAYMVSERNSRCKRIYDFFPLSFTAAFWAASRNKRHSQIPPKKQKICYRYDSISLRKFQVLLLKNTLLSH